MGRDGYGERGLGRASARTGAPAAALVVVMAVAIAGIAAMRLNGTNVVNAFFYPGTIGVLSLLVAYIVTNVGAIRLFLTDMRERVWETGIPVLAILFLAYVLWRNVSGQVYPYSHFWQVVGAWLIAGLVVVFAVPGLAGRIGAGLSGLGQAPAGGD
jgi:hypothetical protein